MTQWMPILEGGKARNAGKPLTPQPQPQPQPQPSHNLATKEPAPAATPLDAVRISCLTNAHYHASREAFLDTVHRWFMFLIIIFGAAAIADLLPKSILGVELPLKNMLVGGTAVLGALDLTFDLCNRARAHSMMKRRYFELLADFHEKRKTPEEVRACLERYSADEEPAYRVLFLASWNIAQETVYGDAAEKYDIPKRNMACKNFCRRPTASYPVISGA